MPTDSWDQLARPLRHYLRSCGLSDETCRTYLGKRVNHLLHFFVGIFTLGAWWIVWAIMAIAGGERRKMLTVDEYGNVLFQKAG